MAMACSHFCVSIRTLCTCKLQGGGGGGNQYFEIIGGQCAELYPFNKGVRLEVRGSPLPLRNNNIFLDKFQLSITFPPYLCAGNFCAILLLILCT